MASNRPVNSSNSVTGFEMTWATVTCGGGGAAAAPVAASLRAQALRVAEMTASTERVRAGLEKTDRLNAEYIDDSLNVGPYLLGVRGARVSELCAGCRYWCSGVFIDMHRPEGGYRTGVGRASYYF